MSGEGLTMNSGVYSLEQRVAILESKFEEFVRTHNIAYLKLKNKFKDLDSPVSRAELETLTRNVGDINEKMHRFFRDYLDDADDNIADLYCIIDDIQENRERILIKSKPLHSKIASLLIKTLTKLT
jgi:hypothetical protein